ncbi:MAG: hypothetical protein ACLVEJ_12785 [Parabacteroides sp.]
MPYAGIATIVDLEEQKKNNLWSNLTQNSESIGEIAYPDLFAESFLYRVPGRHPEVIRSLFSVGVISGWRLTVVPGGVYPA